MGKNAELKDFTNYIAQLEEANPGREEIRPVKSKTAVLMLISMCELVFQPQEDQPADGPRSRLTPRTDDCPPLPAAVIDNFSRSHAFDA